MRASALCLPTMVAPLVFSVAACNRDPGFDARFDAEAAKLSADAATLQNEMKAQLDAATAAKGAAK